MGQWGAARIAFDICEHLEKRKREMTRREPHIVGRSSFVIRHLSF